MSGSTAPVALVGCSGWDYRDWRNGVFYPPRLAHGDWLRHYAGRFPTVELNATFYRLPRATAAERWEGETPPWFRFSVKVSRYVTHVRRLREPGRHVALLLERLDPLLRAGKVDVLLWQLPPNLPRDDELLSSALAEFPPALRHAVEFRHPSWFAHDVLELLRERRVALVIADRPELHGIQPLELTADFTYLRFHHGSRGRRGNYSDSELREWADRISAWRKHAAVYAYFNNDWEGFAPANALLLTRLLQTR